MVDQGEEADIFGGVDEFGGDFVDAGVKVPEGDLRNGTVDVFGCHCDGKDYWVCKDDPRYSL